MFEKIALLGIFSDANLRQLPCVISRTVSSETERLYIRISDRYPLALRLSIQKAIRECTPESIVLDISAVSDTAIRWLHLYHNYVKEHYT